MDLFLFSTFFTKFYSLRNRGLQVTDIQKRRCRVFLEVITSTILIIHSDDTEVDNAYACLIKERVNEFVIEKYIEVNISTEIVYADATISQYYNIKRRIIIS